jgi:uncharacterized membrane protein (UPF0127 family)
MARDKRRFVRVIDAASGSLVATAELADTPLARMKGLLGRDHLAQGTALLLDPCDTIHTWFMRFPIDVVFAARDGEVVRAFDDVGPFRFARGTRRARVTLELPSGMRRRAQIDVGSRLRFEPA